MGAGVTIEIEKMVYGGRGMGRLGGKVMFVPFTAPGDWAEVRVAREKKDYTEGHLKILVQDSPLRVPPFCQVYGDCGGCHYQHIRYSEQLRLKGEILQESFARLARKDKFVILPIIPSSKDKGYRIRVRFKGGMKYGQKVLGFYGLKSHRVVEVKNCPLLHPLANEILQGLQNWQENRKGWGMILEAEIQVSPEESQGVIGLRVTGEYSIKFAEELSRKIPGLKGVVLDGRRKIRFGDLTLAYRWPPISDQLGLMIRADYDSFSQVNLYQNWNLMRQVVEWAALSGKEKVLDLFCGSGNLTLPLAQRANEVWGVDQDRKAVENAAENARMNGLGNCRFIAARADIGIRQVFQRTGGVDAVVLDPPRSGARDILEDLARLGPRRIIYVSCEPPTLTRDLAHLQTLGYHVRRIQPIDMFPHTYHIEVMAELTPGE